MQQTLNATPSIESNTTKPAAMPSLRVKAGPVELDVDQLKHVSGGSPKGTWIDPMSTVDSPKGTWL